MPQVPSQADFDTLVAQLAALGQAVGQDLEELDRRVGDLETAAQPTPDVSAYPGQPAPGTFYWGSTLQGNGDPTQRHELDGQPLPVRRTFWQWDEHDRLVATAAEDLATGRLPWLSTKTPPWDAVGRGEHDDHLDALLTALAALDGPVWLTFHHEPEGPNGIDDPSGPAGHVAMNRRVRQRMDALGVDNVALVLIMMAWSLQFDGDPRHPSNWWADGIYDVAGFDHYRNAEAPLVNDQWFTARQFAADRGVDVAVGEWGMRGVDAAAGARVREWYDHAAGSHADGKGGRVVALSAFDSGLNSPDGAWTLDGEQLAAFHERLADPRTARIGARP